MLRLANPFNAASLCRYKKEDLDLIDNQGRCLITDHGALVLFAGMPQTPFWQHSWLMQLCMNVG